MKPIIDVTKEYGLVLEGGGAKGAYQIGVWKALREAGIQIKGVAGTSVGALNGAMVCMDELEKAEEIWKHLTYSQVIQVEDEEVRQIRNNEIPIREAASKMFKYIGGGGFDVSPLQDLIEKILDEDRIRNSPIDFYVKTFSVDEFRELEVDMKTVADGQMKDFLLASAYLFPIFKTQKLHGKTYVDGGAVNNVPLDTLVHRGYKDIIVVRIFGIGRYKKVKLPEGTQVVTIGPRVNLGNTMEFEPEKNIRNMKIGYYDGKRAIYGLKGHIYYIEESQEECYYLKHLLQIPESVKEKFVDEYHLKEEGKVRLREMIETVFPTVAEQLQLSRDWDYRDLYLAILEATAKICRVPKYHIYTVEELRKEVVTRLSRFSEEEKLELPVFVRFFEE